MVPMRKYGLFGMYIYHPVLVTLSFNKFHLAGTTYLTDKRVQQIQPIIQKVNNLVSQTNLE